MLPSEFSLSEQLGISRLVVHRAFRELVTEGLLIRKRAKGTFVSPPVKRSYPVVGPLFSMTETRDERHADPETKILMQEVIPRRPQSALELHLPEGAAVIHSMQPAAGEGTPAGGRGYVLSRRAVSRRWPRST